jgi:hypothetical protein
MKGKSLRTRHQGINKSRGSKQPRFRTSKIIPKNLIDNLQSPIDTSTSVIMFTQSLRASVCPIPSFWPYSANNYSAPRSPVSRDSKLPAWEPGALSSLPLLFVKVRSSSYYLPHLISPCFSSAESALCVLGLHSPSPVSENMELTFPSSGSRPRTLPQGIERVQGSSPQSQRLRRPRPKVVRSRHSKIP